MSIESYSRALRPIDLKNVESFLSHGITVARRVTEKHKGKNGLPNERNHRAEFESGTSRHWLLFSALLSRYPHSHRYIAVWCLDLLWSLELGTWSFTTRSPATSASLCQPVRRGYANSKPETPNAEPADLRNLLSYNVSRARLCPIVEGAPARRQRRLSSTRRGSTVRAAPVSSFCILPSAFTNSNPSNPVPTNSNQIKTQYPGAYTAQTVPCGHWTLDIGLWTADCESELVNRTS